MGGNETKRSERAKKRKEQGSVTALPALRWELSSLVGKSVWGGALGGKPGCGTLFKAH